MNATTSNDKRPSRNARGGQYYLGALLLAMSVCAPFFVLIRQIGRVVDALPLAEWSAISPFGTVGVVFVHVVATFALSWTLGRAIRPYVGHATVLRVGTLAIVAGVFSVATLYWGENVGDSIVQSPAGTRLMLRLLWTLCLQAPWCVTAAMLLVPEADTGDRFGAAWMLVLLAATLLPMTHANHVTRKKIARVEEYLSRQQYRLAWNHLVALESFAGVQQVSQRPSDELRGDLFERLQLLLRQANQPLAETASVEAVIERASQYVSLNALGEARALLESVQDKRPDVLLVLAAVHEERRDSPSAIAALEEAANLIGDEKGTDAEEIGRQIYQRWAQYLRLVGRYPEAEQRLGEALQRFPNSQGFLLFELGLHNRMGGRFKTALDYYESAAEADPRYRQRVAAAIGKLRVDTPACILRPTKLATR
jgi:tetratricopeptide (TPR) repeat protein